MRMEYEGFGQGVWLYKPRENNMLLSSKIIFMEKYECGTLSCKFWCVGNSLS